jgi:beta-phosphoglucomutase-like phosphatase (HAD superfamily)
MVWISKHSASPSGLSLAGCGWQSLEALIFDVDGTLAETEEIRRQAFNEGFRGFWPGLELVSGPVGLWSIHVRESLNGDTRGSAEDHQRYQRVFEM